MSQQTTAEFLKDSLVGYCTNVHAGISLEQVKDNLIQHTLKVKSAARPDGPMGIGLWLCRSVCDELQGSSQIGQFADWLAEHDLIPFTFNGFPYANFHQDVVKHRVYLPTWAETDRLDYTVMLAEIQCELLSRFPDSGNDGSISTLPLGWPLNSNDDSFLSECAANLRRCAERFHELRQKTGRHIFLCIEPEPGCRIDNAPDLVDFFREHFATGDSQQDARNLNYVGVCHDICHSAVMFEEQDDALECYRNAGIRVGKFQVSSAIQADFRNIDQPQVDELRSQLRQFVEPRYLHQTSIAGPEELDFFEDLPDALAAHANTEHGVWRVHFHVPLFLESIGALQTTQDSISSCLHAIQVDNDWPLHFELETYAWTVLPTEQRDQPLAQGISEEFRWFDQLISKLADDDLTS